VLATSACSVETRQRCEDIDEILVARGEQLPAVCELDEDCQIIEVRPGVAAVTTVDYDHTRDDLLIEEYERSCGEFERRYRSAIATCEVEDVVGRCQLVTQSAFRDIDVGTDADLADVVCTCETSGDCPAEAPTCDGCVCLDACGVSCSRIRQCGLLRELGYGRSLADCTVRCNELAASDPDRAASQRGCIAASSCNRLEDCRL